MKYILLSLSFLIPFVLFASVNDGMITGKVLSVDGDAVDYATLSLKGTGYSASTNDKGIYHLSAPAGSYTLVVNAVGFEKKEEQGQDIKLEQINEMLSDALSLLILLENDMEIQKSDGIHARILKMIHGNLKGIQKELSAYMRQEEE